MVFQSRINVPESKELTICYMGRPFCTHLERQSRLRTHIRYACLSCQPTPPLGHASNTRCLFVRSLDQIVAFEIKMNKALLVYGLQDPVTSFLQLIKTIQHEGLYGKLMTAYRNAANCLKSRGHFEEALDFARLELAEEVVCLENNSEVVYKTKKYIQELEKLLGGAR